MSVTTLEEIYAGACALEPHLYEDFDDFMDFILRLMSDVDEPGDWVEAGLIRVTRTEHSHRISICPYAAIPLDYYD